MKPCQRFFFWFLLTVLSTFFAEVTVGSAPMVFFKPDGWLLTVPVYGLHILVLTPLVIRPGRVPLWQSLYLAGTIVGLYEAYMTKILWSPTWNPASFKLAGVAVTETLMLVFFWHPVMAFIVPLIFSERFLRLKPAIIPGLGEPWTGWLSSYRFYLIIGSLAGLVFGSFLGEPGAALGICLLNGSLILVLLVIWNAVTRNAHFGFDSLLPGEISWRVFIVLLLIDFVILGVFIRTEAIPNWNSQLTIWAMYGGLGFLMIQARSRQPLLETPLQAAPAELSAPSPICLWGAFILPFTLSCLVSAVLLAPVRNYFMLAFYIICIPCGLLLFFRSIRHAYSR
jgi:hypothetical protein